MWLYTHPMTAGLNVNAGVHAHGEKQKADQEAVESAVEPISPLP